MDKAFAAEEGIFLKESRHIEPENIVQQYCEDFSNFHIPLQNVEEIPLEMEILSQGTSEFGMEIASQESLLSQMEVSSQESNASRMDYSNPDNLMPDVIPSSASSECSVGYCNRKRSRSSASNLVSQLLSERERALSFRQGALAQREAAIRIREQALEVNEAVLNEREDVLKQVFDDNSPVAKCLKL